MRIRLITLFVAGYLATAATAKADAVYAFSDTHDGFSWSFEVPAILTTNTIVRNFLSMHISPTGFIASLGCTTSVGSVFVTPQLTAPPAGNVSTNFTTGCDVSSSTEFSTPITSFGTFTVPGITLTISPSAAVPEPSSLLLLGAGVIGVFSIVTLTRPGKSL